MDKIKFTIYGQPYSKANSRIWIQSRKMFIKSKKAIQYCSDFATQCPRLNDLMLTDVCVSMTIFYASLRPDLDESLILDCMQGRIYKNDRQVKKKIITHGLDRKNPRSEIIVEAL